MHQQCAPRLDATLSVHKSIHLIGGARVARLRNGPGCFLPHIFLFVIQRSDDERHDVAIKDLLHLLLRPRQQVGNHPACMLHQSGIPRQHQRTKVWHNSVVQQCLGLAIRSGGDVSNYHEGRDSDRLGWMREKLHHPHAYTRFEDAVDSVVGTVTHAGRNLASVFQYLLIQREHERHGDIAKWLHGVVSHQWLAGKQMRQRLGCCTDQGCVGWLALDDVDDGWHDIRVQHGVAMWTGALSDTSQHSKCRQLHACAVARAHRQHVLQMWNGAACHR
mmetsp:Transcript_2208/g.5658  ORF Transcript_2208/g.5658 Transcript_2208/m.5658 type:complete len:275 (+) Transcript_2208:331-1155(+)